MTCASLHAARIARPLHGVDHRVETRVHQFTHVTPPLFSALHDRLHLPINQRCLVVGSSCLSIGNIGQKMLPFSDIRSVCKFDNENCAMRRNKEADSGWRMGSERAELAFWLQPTASKSAIADSVNCGLGVTEWLMILLTLCSEKPQCSSSIPRRFRR